MSKKLEVICNGCYTHKSATDQWWTIAESGPGTMLRITEFDKNDSRVMESVDFCSFTCASKFIGTWMMTRKGAQ